MTSEQSDPVIIGSSLTGLLVSFSLSKQDIPHVLIGSGVPPQEPRLGESMNECATTELWRLFGDEFIEHFHVKSHISLLNGKFASMIYLAKPTRSLQDEYDMGGGSGNVSYIGFLANLLIHVDRVEFDRALYEKTRAESACKFIEANVAGIQYNADTDTVDGLTLSDGTALDNPKYVFDCTGPRCLIGETAGVGNEAIGAPQRVVWTHYRANEKPMVDPDWWSYGTNLLRLDEATDGIDGISWLIPLGDTVSAGVSVDSERFGADVLDGERVLELLAEAYERRGVNYRSAFPNARPAIDMKHCYSIRERAYGANWLLTGGGFIQIWFPSSAGMWTTTAASELASRLIETPMETGAAYEKMMRHLLAFHDHLEEMIHGDVFQRHQDVYRFWIRWLGLIPERLADHMSISRPQTVWARMVERSFRRGTRLVPRFGRFALMCGMMLTVYVCREEDISNFAHAYPNYHIPRRFRVSCYLKGLPHLLKSLKKRPHMDATGSPGFKVLDLP